MTVTVYQMSAEDFMERFEPGEYDFELGWDGTADHPAFSEPNPFNPDRIHAGTWEEFVADIAAHGIQVPVEIDDYSEELGSGHHRVIAAHRTGQPIRFTTGLDLTTEIAKGTVVAVAEQATHAG